ncbi:MAG: T9SS type A sorting domain-containing protein [Bacteroidales bacterium]
MRKIYALLAFLSIAFSVNAQDSLRAVGWITYPTDVDWSTTTHEKMNVDIMKAPAGWTFDESTFDLSELWDSLGTANEVKNWTDQGGEVPYASGEFGSEWKAFYDAENLYVCLKYYDKDMLATASATDSRSWEIMYQTKYADRYDQGWTTCQTTQYKNQQYGRFLVLGGGKSLVKPEGVTEFAGSNGTKVTGWNSGVWEGNPNILDPAPLVLWDVDANNTVWCVVQYNFANHMYYLDNIWGGDTITNRVSFDPTVKNKISFDVKSNATIDSAGTGTLKKNEFFWNSTKNDGFEAVYYSGYLTFTDNTWRPEVEPPSNDSLRAVGWITYPADVDWATTPFEKLNVTIKQAPEGWTFDESTFNLKDLWDAIGSDNEIKKFTDQSGGVEYSANNFGSSWKAFYDAENLYVCMKYYDKELKATSGSTDSRAWEVMYQTKYADRYEPGWTTCETTLYKNQQYARFLVLGGGKSLVTEGGVTEFASSNGTKVTGWNSGVWEGNPNVLDPAPVVIWDVDAENTIWCTVQYNFETHMYYLDKEFGGDTITNRVTFNPAVKNKISFDVKSNAQIDSAGTGTMKKNEFFWNADKNDGFEAIYYNGYITFGSEKIIIEGVDKHNANIGVYMSGDVLRLKGINNADVQVYSTLGQLVKSGRSVNELNLRDLKTGIYLVRLNNYPSAFKVFKQ